MKVTLLLADAAQTADGKLYILGGGWSVIGPDIGPTGIAMKLEVPWDQANRRHKWQLLLNDADGQRVSVETPEGKQTIDISGEFEVGRPPGLAPGTAIDLPLAINIGPLPLPPGQRYTWQLKIDGYTEELWQVDFTVRPANSNQGG